MGAAGAIPGIRTREVVTLEAAGVHPPIRGRYLRPRAVVVDQTPEKILDPNPNRLGAWIFNNGGYFEQQVGLPVLPGASVIDSEVIQVPPQIPSSFKTWYLVVDTQLAWTNAGQPTVQLVVGRARSGQAGAGSSQANALGQKLKGTAVSLGPAAATTLAVGLWPFSAADIADLQWPFPFVGLELAFPSGINSGAGRLFLEMQGSPNLLLGEDQLIRGEQVGSPAGAFIIPAQGPAQWVQADGELWAAASPGGTLDIRIWEILIEAPAPGRPTYA